MKKLDEEQIIALLQQPATRKKAFEQIVSAYSEKLYWQIRRMVLTHEDSNDLLQNTFIKAWTKLEDFRGESKISTWLYRIAINESLTFLSQKSHIQHIPLDSPDAAITERLEGDPYFNGNDAQALLQEALQTLPDKQRLVFNLKYFQEMKYEEMSELLGTSVGALKASYHIAVKKISTFLEGYI